MNERREMKRGLAGGVGAMAILGAVLSSCGGSESRDVGSHAVLFDGPPGELLPHEIGRTSRFLVSARSGDDTIWSLFTTRVLSEGPDGEFILESAPDGGRPRRIRAREVGDQVRLEAVAVEQPDGFLWADVRPPAVLVQTPVIAGEALETRFVRTVEVLLEIDGVQQARSITFEGTSERTPRAREEIIVGDRALSALAFDVRGESQLASVGDLADDGSAPTLRLALRGTEYRSPGVGLVREVAKLTIQVGDANAVVHLRTEREFDHEG